MQKVIFCGLENVGKTSILLLLDKKYSLLDKKFLKPTINVQRTNKSFSLLGLEISNWDLGGQRNFREEYLKNKKKYFTFIHSIFFVIDIQDRVKFEEALKYLGEILNIILELNPNHPEFSILFHKYDPDIKSNEEILGDINNLEIQIKNLNTKVKFSFYRTSIYDPSSIIKSFSEGVISRTQKSKLIQTLLKKYMSKSFNSATVLLDTHSFIIASRATKEEYEQVCKEIAPRLTLTIEKLEEQDINPLDIVTNIEFPQISDEQKNGLIFLKKFDINQERLYLITLCLNKKIKAKSYEYLPILTEKLRNLFESFD
ncbi:MAG: ADP-ribosylation factor-like protein [Promethearchaeota archaeon]